MGLNVNKRIPLTPPKKHCDKCNLDFPVDFNFCSECGKKLKKLNQDVYANIGKNGISSISVKSNNMTINSKGNITIPIAPGISYKFKGKKKK